eukprot:TRINITY_DN24761_c0_g1_i1.p1 TRINITY_DN24761_c0_g1~~TRINITY_DN24761_c0_g1_i1.p1  ORF type:complete len:899 (+),score=228.48 TRINITY_DN24761_c0_g1_i1:43-2739(+)
MAGHPWDPPSMQSSPPAARSHRPTPTQGFFDAAAAVARATAAADSSSVVTAACAAVGGELLPLSLPRTAASLCGSQSPGPATNGQLRDCVSSLIAHIREISRESERRILLLEKELHGARADLDEQASRFSDLRTTVESVQAQAAAAEARAAKAEAQLREKDRQLSILIQAQAGVSTPADVARAVAAWVGSGAPGRRVLRDLGGESPTTSSDRLPSVDAAQPAATPRATDAARGSLRSPSPSPRQPELLAQPSPEPRVVSPQRRPQTEAGCRPLPVVPVPAATPQQPASPPTDPRDAELGLVVVPSPSPERCLLTGHRFADLGAHPEPEVRHVLAAVIARQVRVQGRAAVLWAGTVEEEGSGDAAPGGGVGVISDRCVYVLNADGLLRRWMLLDDVACVLVAQGWVALPHARFEGRGVLVTPRAPPASQPATVSGSYCGSFLQGITAALRARRGKEPQLADVPGGIAALRLQVLSAGRDPAPLPCPVPLAVRVPLPSRGSSRGQESKRPQTPPAASTAPRRQPSTRRSMSARSSALSVDAEAVAVVEELSGRGRRQQEIAHTPVPAGGFTPLTPLESGLTGPEQLAVLATGGTPAVQHVHPPLPFSATPPDECFEAGRPLAAAPAAAPPRLAQPTTLGRQPTPPGRRPPSDPRPDAPCDPQQHGLVASLPALPPGPGCSQSSLGGMGQTAGSGTGDAYADASPAPVPSPAPMPSPAPALSSEPSLAPEPSPAPERQPPPPPPAVQPRRFLGPAPPRPPTQLDRRAVEKRTDSRASPVLAHASASSAASASVPARAAATAAPPAPARAPAPDPPAAGSGPAEVQATAAPPLRSADPHRRPPPPPPQPQQHPPLLARPQASASELMGGAEDTMATSDPLRVRFREPGGLPQGRTQRSPNVC